MISVYGSLLTILICTFIPPVIDRFKRGEENWKWTKSVLGYGVMTITILVLPMLIGDTDLLFIIPAIAFASLIVPITYAGTLFVIFLARVVLIIVILWDFARNNVGKEPLRFVLDQIEWHAVVLPLIVGIITLFTINQLFPRLRKI